MLTPGATISGYAPTEPPQLVGPRLLIAAMPSEMSTEPTAKASGLLAGLGEEFVAGPKLPAAKTGVIFAATNAARSGSNVRSQPGEPSVHELLTMRGASLVSGSPSGSSAHWNARWIAVEVPVPASLKMRAAIQRACGATPMAVPPADPPSAIPAVSVP